VDSPQPPASSPPSLPPPAKPPAARDLLRLALAFYGVVALFAFGYALFSNGLEQLFGERAPTLLEVAVGLLLGVALVALTRAAAAGWPPMGRMRDALVEILGAVRWREALGLALLSGFAEELLFRGALWQHLGLWGTTCLFALVHAVPRRKLWPYPLFALIAGLVFGLLRESSGSIWPPMLGHVTVNAWNLHWIGAFARRKPGPPAT
jgi:membrane protease YdiL (CAAX protease family)